MISIFAKIKNKKDLSHNEQLIANYILKHPEEILKMNSKQLSKACFVSPATIYRLCDKLDLSGFSQLKVEISSSIDEYLKIDQNFDFNFPVKQYQTHFEIIKRLQEDYQQTLVSTANLFDLDQIRLIVNAMKKAEYIDIYTSSGNVYFALNFQFQMQEIGVPIQVPVEEYSQRLLAASSDEKHLAIILTFGGRGMLMENLPKILNRQKTPMVLISSPEYAFKDIESDYHLHISPFENHYNKISSFSTRLSILYIFDVLYTCYFELDYENNLAKKLAYYQTIRELYLRK